MNQSFAGLSEKEVRDRIAAGQVNTAAGNVSKTKKQIFRTHLLTYFNFLNLVLGALVLSTGSLRDMTFLITIVANSVIGIVQELRVKSLVDKLSVITASKAKVIRAEGEAELPLDQLVLDDLVRLETGDQIGADCILLNGQGVEVNESMITGESVPVKKAAGDTLLSGSFLVAGSCVARVIHVGEANYATILASQAKNKKRASSEMQLAINRIIKTVGFIIIPVGIMLFLSQRAIEGITRNELILNTVSGVIGMIPEGLVLLTSVSFIVGVGKLAMKQALVQEMEAIEALARVNVLCLDKTGTITTGQLEVEQVIPCGSMSEEQIQVAMQEITYAFGDVNPTQQALKDHYTEHEGWPADDVIPFSSARKYRAVSFAGGKGAYVLGAPEFIMPAGAPVLEECNTHAAKGLRVLLLASVERLNTENGSVEGPVPQAMILISDCVRKEAASTFAYFKSQNVAIKVISGDNPATVSQIAVKAGLAGGERYVDAQTLPADPEQLRKVVDKYTVFGRVTPEQKQRLVKAYQANQKVVGMVGDGVNDVLALKDADCGIAMAAGSDAARQVAHIVLLDSDFIHLREIVREGRSIIANIERVSALYLTKTIYSVLLCVIFIMLGRSYPFTPIQLMLVSVLCIGIPSFFLALEPNEGVSSRGFLMHVLRISLPGALTMVFSMLIVQWASSLLGFDAVMTSTYNVLLSGFISMMVLIMVCSPMNRLRNILCNVMIALYAANVILIPQFFSINSLFHWRMIFMVPIIVLTYICMRYLAKLLQVILRNR